MADYDAIVIGGGLAGAAFALKLARGGARVAVVERTPAPTPKVCGDFLSHEAVDLLSQLGLDVARLGATSIRTLRLVHGEKQACAQLPFAAAGLSRLTLDEELLALVQDAGAEIVRGVSANGLEPDGASVRVRVGTKTLTASHVALATGKHNVRGWPRAAGTQTAYKIQLTPSKDAARDLDGIVQLVSYRGGYVGACNVEDGNATICWLADPRLLQSLGSDWRRHLDHIAGRSSAIGGLLRNARYLSDRPVAVSGIPYGYVRRTAIAPNVYAVGDQLSVIPSFTGDGTSLALASGVAGANAVLEGRAAGAFQAAFLDGIRLQFHWARVVDATFKWAPLRAFAIGAVGVVPSAARLAARLTRVRPLAQPAGAKARAR